MGMTEIPSSASGTQFAAIRRDIVKELFLKTADQTYVVARWCFLNGLYLDFYWNGVHARKVLQGGAAHEQSFRQVGGRRRALRS